MTETIFKKIQSSVIIQVLIIIAFGIYVLPQIEEPVIRLIAYAMNVLTCFSVIYSSYVIKDITTNLDYNPRFYRLSYRDLLEVNLLKHSLTGYIFLGFGLLVFIIGHNYVLNQTVYLALIFLLCFFNMLEKQQYLIKYFRNYENVKNIYEVEQGQRIKYWFNLSTMIVLIVLTLYLLFLLNHFFNFVSLIL